MFFSISVIPLLIFTITEIIHENYNQVNSHIIFLVSSVVAISIVSIILAKKMSSPLETMIHIMKNTSMEKPYVNTINTDDERDELSQAIYDMNQAMRVESKQLLELNQGINRLALVSCTDIDGNITYANEKFCQVSKYSKEELIGKNHRILKSGYHSAEFYKDIWNTISNGKIWEGVIKNLTKDGSFYWVKTVIMPSYTNNKTTNYISISIDITKQENLLMNLESTHATLKDQMKESIHQYSLEKQLLATNAKLESEKKFRIQKNEFTAMVSHELKTPIFPIKMHCQMLKDTSMMGKLSPEQLQSVNQIEIMANRLQSLTDDILDAQKLDMNQMKFTKTKFSLREFFDNMKKTHKPLMDKKNISLITSCNDLEIYTDRDRLFQVFSNLIQNAVDFVSNDTGKIQINAVPQNDDILLSVKDNGIGIPTEKISDLFRKFYQIDTTLKRKHGGTGLGLVICKGIIEGLCGNIWVDSELGKGTTFYIKIPMSKSYDYITGYRNPLLETE